MGCGASKDVVSEKEKANGLKSPPPEKAPPATSPNKDAGAKPVIPEDKHNHQDSPAGEAQPNKTQPPSDTKPASTEPHVAAPTPVAAPANPPSDASHPAANPPSSTNSQPPSSAQPTSSPQPNAPSSVPSAALPPPNPDHKKLAEDLKPAEKHEEGKEKPTLPPNLNLGDMTDRRKAAQLLEFDMSAPATPSTPSSKSAVRERLERHAEDRKVGVLRPSSASLERRLADADSRRKQHADQKMKKAKYTNELAKDKYSELREAEEKKTAELMQLIKNKNAQASTNRTQKQQEATAKAEADVVKARELSARRKESGSNPQTPKTPHSPDGTDETSTSILEVPLPPLK